ncbi:hypothetical protein O181_008421 [Austropuccinia psidii MF-1]|uniref:Uncharacterized protein n=1 Tax=Austropuccinia psidii MF-1 TaxID=1389203 RepID=A0A9Q3BMI6_9BASI|nr:hypothetical protein [Austropuccinia psidii MF-1]
MEPIVLQIKGKKDKELVEEPKSFICRPEEGVGNDSSFGERRTSGFNQLQTSSISVQTQAQGAQKKQRGLKNNQGKGKCRAIWNRTYPQAYRIPKLEPSAVSSVLNVAITLMEFTAKDQEMMNRTFPCK